MPQKNTEKIKRMRNRRDAKALPHLQQYAPVWLVNEESIPQDDALLFNVVFFHPAYGWVNRRYRYDSFNDVLYHKGQTLVTEEYALELEEQTPYISAEAINTINSYGG
jgi:hypothetical protein